MMGASHRLDRASPPSTSQNSESGHIAAEGSSIKQNSPHALADGWRPAAGSGASRSGLAGLPTCTQAAFVTSPANRAESGASTAAAGRTAPACSTAPQPMQASGPMVTSAKMSQPRSMR